MPLEPRALRMQSHDGVEINVWEYGGDGPLLLLCHCNGTHGRGWEPVIAQLGGRFRIVAPDARGHGDSGKPAAREAYRWDHAAEDVVAVLEATLRAQAGTAHTGRDKSCFAAGHSFGGALVAWAALKRPDLFSRLMLIDPIIAPSGFYREPALLAEQALRRKEVFPSRVAVRERFGAKPPMNRWTGESLDAYVIHGFFQREDGTVAIKCPPQAESWTYEAAMETGLFEQLSKLQGDVMLVTGSGSDVRPLVERQRRVLPQAPVHEFRETGHFIPQERPEELAALMIEWFVG